MVNIRCNIYNDQVTIISLSIPYFTPLTDQTAKMRQKKGARVLFFLRYEMEKGKGIESIISEIFGY